MFLKKSLRACVLSAFLLGFVSCGDKDDGKPSGNKPEISVDDVTMTEGNENSIIQIRIRLSGPSDANVVLRYSTKNVTAVAGSDYIGLSDVTTTIEPGKTELLVPVTIIGDKFNEPDETFELVIISALNATVVRSKAVITIKNDDSGSDAITIPSTGYTTPEEYAGYTLVWSDEFRGPAVDENNWTFEIGNGSNGWGNNELQYYKKENSSIYDGEYLMITAKTEQTGEYAYTSSRLISRGKREFTFGRVDIRAAMPIGKGIWPALWALGADIGTNPWPACGEIDIMEFLGHDPERVHGTAHWGQGTHKYKGGSTLSGSEGNFHEAFHVFTIIWEKDKIEWYVDDKKYYTITADDMEGQPYPFNKPQFFLINCAVGGNWPGSPDGSTVFPQRYFVDYIRIFQKN